MPDTNAVKWLRAQGVAFEVLEYTFTEIGADHAAEAGGAKHADLAGLRVSSWRWCQSVEQGQ